MTNMTPTTASEKKLNKAIQKAIGAAQDGVIGPASAVDLAAKVGADCWPLTIELYGQPVIVCKDIIISNPKAGCKNYSNSISGSFSHNKQPCSIAVAGDETLCFNACHSWLGQRESVIYRLKDGSFGAKRCLTAGDLPKNIRWAVGGMGLGKLYAPKEEGFTGQYADVLRRTNHTAIGIKGDMIYLIYAKKMTGAEVNTLCAEKLQLDYAIMLDGGHVAAMNGEEHFSKINGAQAQYYLIQGV